MNYIDLFSGIGGFALGAYWAGMRFDRHYFSEINPYCVELYRKRFPGAEPLGDIHNYKNWRFDGNSIFTAGFPCQPFSRAGERKLKEDDDYLWPVLSECIFFHEPALVILENVTDIDSGEPISVLEEIYNDLDACNYETLPPLEIPAAGFNAPHRRNRAWIVAHSKKSGWRPGRRISQKKTMENEPVGLDEAIFRQKLSSGFYGRGYDGVPRRLDRLRALGNSIVPQIAQMFFSVIKELI